MKQQPGPSPVGAHAASPSRFSDTNVYRLNGTTWSTGPHFATYGFGIQVSCAAPSFCRAATPGCNGPSDAAVPGVWSYYGTNWTAQEALTLLPTSISCVSHTFCVAADRHGHVQTYA